MEVVVVAIVVVVGVVGVVVVVVVVVLLLKVMMIVIIVAVAITKGCLAKCLRRLGPEHAHPREDFLEVVGAVELVEVREEPHE